METMRMTCGSGTSPSRQIGVRRSDRSSCGSKQNVMRCHALFLPEGEPRIVQSSVSQISLSSLQSSPCGLYLRRRKAGQAKFMSSTSRGGWLWERRCIGRRSSAGTLQEPRNICPSLTIRQPPASVTFRLWPSSVVVVALMKATVLSSSSHLYHATPASFSNTSLMISQSGDTRIAWQKERSEWRRVKRKNIGLSNVVFRIPTLRRSATFSSGEVIALFSP
jgi:hypothetical protein